MLALDASAGANFSGADHGSISLTTTVDNAVIILQVFNEKSASYQTVSGISDTAGLTWQRRSQLQLAHDLGSNMEIWWAVKPTAGATTITATLTGAIDDAVLIAFGVAGADTGSPWDASPVLPGKATTNRGVYLPPISTRAAATMLLAFTGTPTGANLAAQFTAPWADAKYQANNGGSRYAHASAAYQIVSLQQNSASAPGITANNAYGVITDAVRAAGATDGIVSFSLDGFFFSEDTTTPSVIHLTTAQPGVVALIAAQQSSTRRHIASVSDTAGLTWTSKLVYQPATPATVTVELWWAVAGAALTDDQITLTFDSAPGDIEILAFGIYGADTTAPWDTDASQPVETASGSAVAPATGSFAIAADKSLLLLAVAAQANGMADFTGSLQQLYNSINSGGSSFCSLGLNIAFFEAPAAGLAYTSSATLANHALVALAAKAAPAGPPPGIDLAAAFADEATLAARVTILSQLALAASLVDDAVLAATLTKGMPAVDLGAVAFSDDAAFSATITISGMPPLFVEFADEAALAATITISAAGADLAAAFTDDAELSALLSVQQLVPPPIQTVVVLTG